MEKTVSRYELELALGESIRATRLQKNLDRRTLCDRAGVSMNALRNLETGAGATIKTLVLVIRALERLDWLAALSPLVTINPLHTVRNKAVRERASRRPRIVGNVKKI
jgi:transcriptional regulator with XRE-family HTH domain